MKKDNMLKVRDLLEFLTKQNPDSYVCAFDYDRSDYVRIPKSIVKSVSEAKKFERRKMRRLFSGLPEVEIRERTNAEMMKMFRIVSDSDVLLGLKK